MIQCYSLRIIVLSVICISQITSSVHCTILASSSLNDNNSAGWLLRNDLTRYDDQKLHYGSITPIQSVEREQNANGGSDPITTFAGVEFEPSSCQLVKVVLVLQRPGCQAKAISTYACTGSCPSYVQVSKSMEWRHERSCTCCQQTAVQENIFVLDCPALTPQYREVKTYAPVNCICRSCSDVSRERIEPQELVEVLEAQSQKD